MVRNKLRRIRTNLTRALRDRHLDSIDKIKQRTPGYDALRKEILQLGTDSRAYFGEEYALEGGLALQQDVDEFTSLFLFLKEHAPYKMYLEIGTASGGVCMLLSQKLGFERVFSLDDGQHPRAKEQKTNLAKVPNFKQYLGDSHSAEARAFVTENLKKGDIDLGFIDGDHGYEGVRKDIDLVLDFCRPGTLLIFHDTVACDGVRKAWREIARDKRLTPLAEYVGKHPMGIGVGAVI